MNTAHNAHSPFPRSQPPGLLARILAFLLSGVFLVLAFMFSLIALAAVAVGVAVFAGWLWWKMRAIRKAMRAAQPGTYGETRKPASGDIIEGEAVRTDDVIVQLPRNDSFPR
jgi:hypothetical protein